MNMLSENGVDETFLNCSTPIKRRKRYKRFKTANDFYDKGFHEMDGPQEELVQQYSTRFLHHIHQSRDMLPTRVMTLAESQRTHPSVPHYWLCNGKLLVLDDPKHPKNLSLFQVYSMLYGTAMIF